MKVALSMAALAIVFASCQKNLSTKESSLSATVSSDVLTPLPCHSTSFISDYPAIVGKVPPFTFTKTLYSDTRVKTISMTSRVYPIHQAYQNYSVELKGQFSYAPYKAFLKGTSEIFEHYKFPNGVVKKSISKKNVHLQFTFNENGYCTNVWDFEKKTVPDEVSGGYGEAVLYIVYDANTPDKCNAIEVIDYKHPYGGIWYYPTHDQFGNTLSYTTPNDPKASFPSYVYDYSIPRNGKNYSFIPSQNLICQEYSLLEVMQWVPQSTHQRKGVSGTFFLNDGSKVVQSQVYKNYQFDSKGNQTSVTYGDNVPQRTTWYCK